MQSHLFTLRFNDIKHTKFLFFIYFIVTLKKKIILEENSKKEMFICEINIIIILICQKFTPGLRHKGLANLGP